MAGLIIRIRFFVSSYAILFAILAIRFRQPWLEWVCAGICVFGVATLLLFLHATKKIPPEPMHLDRVSDRGAEVAGYVASYLLPFVTVSEPSPRDLAAYALFLIVVGVVYVRSDMIQINPLLYLLRYQVAAVETSDRWNGYLISRQRPRPDTTVLASRLANTVALEGTDGEGLAPGS
jgi:hypothetical protein